MNSSHQIYPKELKARLDRNDELFLLDVREPSEYELCKIPGSTLIPLMELPTRTNEIDRTKEVIVYCRSGGRSGSAVQYLF